MEKRFGITMGDPASVGPEILLRSLCEIDERLLKNIIIYGNPRVYEHLELELPDKILKCFRHADLPAPEIGTESKESGRQALLFLEQSVEDILQGKIFGIVNGPVSKKAIDLNFEGFIGQTDWYGQRIGIKRAMMCFHGNDFSLALLTHHLPICRCSDFFMNLDLVGDMKTALDGFSKLYKKKVSAMVCGFNPHAGEQGLLSCGEDEKIAEAVEILSKQGYQISGPFPADTLFREQITKKTDLIIACNHDQGLAPFKMKHFETGIAVTFGYKVPRMGVDHGTAYSIAGKNLADHRSMKTAIQLMADVLY